MHLKHLGIVAVAVIAVVVISINASENPGEPVVLADATGIRFADVTTAAGIQQGNPTKMWGSVWGDYNRDGTSDLYVNRHLASALLLRNLGETFQRVTDEPAVTEPFDRHACVWGEANGDGKVDLFCTRGARMGTGEGPNRLFLQTPSGFQNVAPEYGVTDALGRGRTANWIDFDTDGDLDLFVGNKHRDGAPNRLFRNIAGGFARANVGVTHELTTISSTWADWDHDGDPDLLVLQYGHNRPVAYENRGGTFRRVTVPNVTDNGNWKSAAWGDFNGDGWPDVHLVSPKRSLIVANRGGAFRVRQENTFQEARMSTWADFDNDMDLDAFVVQGKLRNSADEPTGEDLDDVLLLNRGGTFERVSKTGWQATSGDGDSVSAGDYDRDGRVDLFITNGMEAETGLGMLLENRSDAGNWALLRLHGGLRNPWGYGARIKVTTPTRTFWRQVGDGANYRSQNDASTIHLGLGGQTTARVRVVWPSGHRDCVTIASSSDTAIARGKNPC